MRKKFNVPLTTFTKPVNTFRNLKIEGRNSTHRENTKFPSHILFKVKQNRKYIRVITKIYGPYSHWVAILYNERLVLEILVWFFANMIHFSM